MCKYNTNILYPIFLFWFFFQNCTAFTIMAQGDKYQNIFVVNVLELIMTKMLQYVGHWTKTLVTTPAQTNAVMLTSLCEVFFCH